MNVEIHSRETIEELLQKDFPNNVAVISFYDPVLRQLDKNYKPVDFSAKTNRVFSVALYDIDKDSLDDYGLTYDTYFPEVNDLAKFIHSANEDGLDIICQCEHGQSRSAGCAAAILEHFCKKGISIFADYRYYPNKLLFHKVLEALERFESI